MKIKALIALALCLCLLAACGGESAESPAGQSANTPSPEENVPAPAETEQPEEHPEYSLYYDYISSVIIPERGLASLEELEYINYSRASSGAYNVTVLEENGCYGLVSAVIRDFDLDGTADLLTFYLGQSLTAETWEPLLGGSYTARSFVLSMELYTLDGDSIVFCDSVDCVNLMDSDSWGGIHVYLEKLEDGIYIYSTASATDYTTEGYAPHTIFHVAQGEFVFDYISGVSYGQGSPDVNQNITMGTANIDPSEYTFSNCFSDPEGVRGVLHLRFDLVDGNAGTMLYCGEDRTGLRDVLENGADTASFPELPQGGLVPEAESVTATKALAYALAEFVSQTSGCVFVEDSVRAGDISVSYYFETEEYTFLNISFDASTYALTRIAVSNGGYPVDAEWYTMKDAVIDWPELGLDRAELEFLYGNGVSMGAYTNGVDITGAKVAIRQIISTDFVIEFVYE